MFVCVNICAHGCVRVCVVACAVVCFVAYVFVCVWLRVSFFVRSVVVDYVVLWCVVVWVACM